MARHSVCRRHLCRRKRRATASKAQYRPIDCKSRMLDSLLHPLSSKPCFGHRRCTYNDERRSLLRQLATNFFDVGLFQRIIQTGKCNAFVSCSKFHEVQPCQAQRGKMAREVRFAHRRHRMGRHDRMPVDPVDSIIVRTREQVSEYTEAAERGLPADDDQSLGVDSLAQCFGKDCHVSRFDTGVECRAHFHMQKGWLEKRELPSQIVGKCFEAPAVERARRRGDAPCVEFLHLIGLRHVEE